MLIVRRISDDARDVARRLQAAGDVEDRHRGRATVVGDTARLGRQSDHERVANDRWRLQGDAKLRRSGTAGWLRDEREREVSRGP